LNALPTRTAADTEAPQNVIEVRGMRNQFGTQVVHENLDLDVRRGEILAVVGGSGAGKSVLLRAIIGLRAADAGEVRLLGENIKQLSAARRAMLEQRIGVLFQDGALFSSLTVAENVAVPLIEHHHLSKTLVERIVALKIALAGLPADAGAKYPDQLSGGMRKRAALRSTDFDPARKSRPHCLHDYPRSRYALHDLRSSRGDLAKARARAR